MILLYIIAVIALLSSALGFYSACYRKSVLFATYSMCNMILFTALFIFTICCVSIETKESGMANKYKENAREAQITKN